MLSRRHFLEILSAAGTLAAVQACSPTTGEHAAGKGINSGKLDRQAILRRNNPRIRSIDPTAVLSVGNGTFAFNVDCTGLQSLPAAYKVIPLCTMSHWGWHSKPKPASVDPKTFRLKQYPFHSRTIAYPTDQTGQVATYNYLRESPHRLHLGRIGFLLDGVELSAAQISNVDQTLDLATGIITSKFDLAGVPVTVTTCCHPTQDGIGLRVLSPLCAARRLSVRFWFPYGSGVSNGDGADWESPQLHTTEIAGDSQRPGEAILRRTLDDFRYAVRVDVSTLSGSGGGTPLGAGGAGSLLKQTDRHQFVITPARELFETTICFDETARSAPLFKFAEAHAVSGLAWRNYWSSGAAIDLSNCTDPRAPELERRIVLSQYLMAIHSAGNLPAQETGLLCNSWYGKFHLEMHWWHSVHFALWNRWDHYLRPMNVYAKMLASARDRSKSQGFAGARWVKMSGPNWAESPSTINPLLIWQQPHPIYYAELCYRHDPSAQTLKQWSEIVDATADFMASFAQMDAGSDRFVLGPAIRTVPENNSDADVNPTYELTAWRFGIITAQSWRERAGLPRKPEWDRVLAKLSPAPQANGLYLAHEGQPTFTPQWTYEHPGMLGALGVLPGDGIDPAIMAATVRKVRDTWDFARVWGWDFPMAAMAAARTGQPDLAIDFLTMDAPKNRYFPNGCNFQRDDLPAYFPGNGGLLAVIAMMVAGWKDGPTKPAPDAPGFPKNGKWNIRSEGFSPII